MTRIYRKWTESERVRLKELARLGIRAPMIARQLDRGLASVTNQAQVMGLSLKWKDEDPFEDERGATTDSADIMSD